MSKGEKAADLRDEIELLRSQTKEKTWGYLLTFFLGPIGYLYSGNYAIAVIMILAAILLSWTIIVPIAIWIICLLMIGPDIDNYNKKLEREFMDKLEERRIRNKLLQSEKNNGHASRLKKLKELKDIGAITESEFQSKKRELLAKI